MNGVIVVPAVATKSNRYARVHLHVRHDDRLADVAPVRASEDRGDGIGEERQRHQDEDPLGAPVRPAYEQQPHEDCRDRDREVLRDMREAERGTDADELTDADAEVRDEHRQRRERRPADAVVLADQLREALAGDRPHPRGHLLDDDQRHRDHDHHPEQVVAELRTDGRVGRDSACIVAGVRGDQARAEEREQGQQAPGGAATRPKARACPQRALAQMPDDSADSARHRLRVLAAGLPRPRHSTPLRRVSCQSSPNRWKWRRQPCGSTSSSTSSTVITPITRSSSSTTGMTLRS